MHLVSKFPYFAVNSFFLLEDKIERPPDFYVVEDTAVFKDNFEEIINFEAGLKLFPTIYKELLSARTAEELGNPLFFRMNQGFYGRRTGALGYPRFSQDASQRVFCGQSVTIINLQLAYWMGFAKVLLVGMDFSYQIPADAKVDGNIIVSQSDDPNHFDPRYFGAGKTWKDPKLSRVLRITDSQKVFEADGRQILNCTVGGALELFRDLPWRRWLNHPTALHTVEFAASEARWRSGAWVQASQQAKFPVAMTRWNLGRRLSVVRWRRSCMGSARLISPGSRIYTLNGQASSFDRLSDVFWIVEEVDMVNRFKVGYVERKPSPSVASRLRITFWLVDVFEDLAADECIDFQEAAAIGVALKACMSRHVPRH